VANSILRWAGSKKRLLPVLRKLAPKKFNRYIEPFAGSACLFFDIKPQQAILADINSDLISMYKAIKKSPKVVYKILESLNLDEETYLKIRSDYNKSKDQKTIQNELENGAYFLYLMRSCYNGIYRTNKSGNFNVPFGSKLAQLDETVFYEASEILQDAAVICQDYRLTISECKKNDFIYLDPPYLMRPRSKHGEYGYSSLDEEGLYSIGSILAELNKKSVKVLISLPLHVWERISIDLQSFSYENLIVNQLIANHAKNRTTRNEIIAFNY
jgi:DNA adenine methylase